MIFKLSVVGFLLVNCFAHAPGPLRYPSQSNRDVLAAARRHKEHQVRNAPPAPQILVDQIESHLGYAAIAYCDSEQRKTTNRNTDMLDPNAKFHYAIDKVATGTHALIYVNRKAKEIVISFRGSDSPSKFLEAASQETIKYPAGGKVHKNTYFFALSIRQELLIQLNRAFTYRRNHQIVLTGHSLGGSLATLMAPVIADSFRINPSRVRVITYNQPRIGNKEFVNWYNQRGFNFTRVTNKEDPVINYPDFKDGWAHVHREVYVDENNNFHLCNTTTLEASNCSYHDRNKLAIPYNHELIANMKISPRGCSGWDFI